ncbi:hypothetical protein Aasi_0120 [Candidatus Amoebophilus asiaticus 5a2]|uniref:Uncharacterized protein n=1 Tax=Amoebophilus asiaticus (strain 5a2) TaxID=452471 RepID=B3EUE8_AMOA5|nr:hypothetical protein [Candidatus Amoebophilus asiaticus]ACE05567.1 hypothetical protein Aasi_0120 [Candidatus Amoebophilus asiaticus 5a2]
MRLIFSKLYTISSSNITITLGIVFLFFINACDCSNPNQGLPTLINGPKDHKKPKQEAVVMNVIPNKLKAGEREVKINFTLSDGFTEARLKKCRLKITYYTATGINKDSYITYRNAMSMEVRKASLDQELSEFYLTSVEQHKSFSLPIMLVPNFTPGMDVLDLKVNFELLDEKRKPLQKDQVSWESQAEPPHKLKLEPYKENKLLELKEYKILELEEIEIHGENREFTVQVSNLGSNITESDQLKLAISRVEGNHASLSIDEENSQDQELDLGTIADNTHISKRITISPGQDEKAKFLLQLLYKGKEYDFLYIEWKKVSPHIRAEYYRRDNHIGYFIDNCSLLPKKVLKVSYKNISNNPVTLGGVTEKFISLENLRTFDHASLPIKFNNQPSAEFEFELLYMDSVLSTASIVVENLQLKIIDPRDGQMIYGSNQATFSIKNLSGARVNIKKVYIQCASERKNAATFIFANPANGEIIDAETPISLSKYIHKETLESEEKVELLIQLKDTHSQIGSSVNLQIQEHYNEKVTFLDEKTLNWVQN